MQPCQQAVVASRVSATPPFSASYAWAYLAFVAVVVIAVATWSPDTLSAFGWCWVWECWG